VEAPVSFDQRWFEQILKAVAVTPVVAQALSPSPTVALLSVPVLAANANRVGFVIYNNSANSVYICLGPTASGVGCHKILATFASWECYGPVCYTGAMSAIRNAGTGQLNIVELVRAPS
jgi:hypothetical protein